MVTPADVNNDGIISPLDALAIVNGLPEGPDETGELPTLTGIPPFFYDVDGNGIINPIDALRVVNALPSSNGAIAGLAAVPEPHLLGVWLVLLLPITRHRRRS